MLPVVSNRQGRLPTTARKLSMGLDGGILGRTAPPQGQLSKTMKTTTPKKKTQCQRLLAYLKKHRKGITTMEAFEHLRITCLHKRIAELESVFIYEWLHLPCGTQSGYQKITRTPERTASGSIVTRYKLAR